MLQKLFIGNDKNLGGRTFAWTVSSGIVYALSSLIFLVVVTNVLGDKSAGIYSIGMVVAQQMLTVGKFAVRNYQVSDVREKYSFADYFSFRIFTCFITVLITIGWVIFGGYTGDRAIVIICMTIYKIAECFSDVFEGLFQQKFRFDVSGKSQFANNLVTIIIFVLMILITRNLVISSIVLAVVSVLMVVIVDVPLVKYFDRIGWVFSFRKYKELTIACFSLFLSSFLYVYINNAPKYAIEGAHGEVALAHFNALFMPVFAVDLLAGFTMRMWLTKMAVFHADGDRKGFKKMMMEQVGVISLITIVSMLFMYFLGGFFLTLIYGMDLYGYKEANALLMLSGGLVSLYTLFENVIIIYRKQHFSIVINIISAIVAAVIVPICTKAGGITGATVGYLIANAARALGYYLTALYYMAKEKKHLAK